MTEFKIKTWPFYVLAIVVIILDQITKIWVNNALDYREVIPVIPFFNITLAYNPGAAFSFLADQPGWQRWFFTVLALVISTVLVVWIKKLKPEELSLGVPLGLILGGAIGNVIDRIAYGHVIDFLDVYYESHHWPAFNIADSAICVGAVLMIWFSFTEASSEDAK